MTSRQPHHPPIRARSFSPVRIDGSHNIVGDNNTVIQRKYNISFNPDRYFLDRGTAIVDLDHSAPQSYPDISNLSTIFSKIENQRLLILSCRNRQEKLDWEDFFAYLAWKIKAERLGNEESYTVRRLISKPNQNHIALANLLHATSASNPTIFLFYGIEPKDVNYTLERLQQDAKKKGHYILIQTETARYEWVLDCGEPEITDRFLDFSLDELLSTTDKLYYLKKELSDFSDKTDYDEQLGRVCKIITNPTDLKRFAIKHKEAESELIKAFSDSIKFERLMADLKQQKSETELAKKRQTFKEFDLRFQLLVIGLSFFSQTFGEQIVDEIDEIACDPWRDRIPGLQAFDLEDVSQVEAFYSLTRNSDNAKSFFDTDYQSIYKIAWTSHRQFFISAHDKLKEILDSKANSRYAVRNRSFLVLHRDKVRTSIQRYFTFLNYQDSQLLEKILPELASSTKPRLRETAARIIADLRDFNESKDGEKLEKIFDGVQLLQSEEVRDGLYNGRRDSNLDATVAMVLGYASEYDSLNVLNDQLANEIMKIIRMVKKKKAYREQNDLVRSAVRDKVVPIVISLHYKNFEDTVAEKLDLKHELFEIAHIDDFFRFRVCEGLAKRYFLREEEVYTKLQEWKFQGDFKDWEKIEDDDLVNLKMSLYLGTFLRFAFDLFDGKEWNPEDENDDREWSLIADIYERLKLYVRYAHDNNYFGNRPTLRGELQYIYRLILIYEGNFRPNHNLPNEEWLFVSKINQAYGNDDWSRIVFSSIFARSFLQKIKTPRGSRDLKIVLKNYPTYPHLRISRFSEPRIIATKILIDEDRPDDAFYFFVTSAEKEIIRLINWKKDRLFRIYFRLIIGRIKRLFRLINELDEDVEIFSNISFVIGVLLKMSSLIEIPIEHEISKALNRKHDCEIELDFDEVVPLRNRQLRSLSWLHIAAICALFIIYRLSKIGMLFSNNPLARLGTFFKVSFVLELAHYTDHLCRDYNDEFEHVIGRLQGADSTSQAYELGWMLNILHICYQFIHHPWWPLLAYSVFWVSALSIGSYFAYPYLPSLEEIEGFMASIRQAALP